MSQAVNNEDAYGIGPDAHFQTKCRCGACSMHFVICSWHEGAHGHSPGCDFLYCPECGKLGVAVLGVERVELPVSLVVPGSSGLAEIITVAEKQSICDNPAVLADLKTRRQKNKLELLTYLAKLEGYELKEISPAA